jgi:hypothetical protein
MQIKKSGREEDGKSYNSPLFLGIFASSVGVVLSYFCQCYKLDDEILRNENEIIRSGN